MYSLHFPCSAQDNVKVIIIQGMPRMVPHISWTIEPVWTILPVRNELQSTRVALLKCRRQEQAVIALPHYHVLDTMMNFPL